MPSFILLNYYEERLCFLKDSAINVKLRGAHVKSRSNENRSGEENVALGRNTAQSSNYSTSYSSLAVDGNTNSDFKQGSCTHTFNPGINWWCVDLQKDVNFQNIKIYNRKTYQFRLQGFELRLSSNGRCNYNGYQQSTVCYKDTSTTTQNIYNINSCNQQQNIQFNGSIVYISVENPDQAGDKYLALCEVEIFEKCGSNCKDGCDSSGNCNNCIFGYHGNKCATPCPTNCNSGCIQNNGDCKACKKGFWGMKCNVNCNKCKQGCQQNNGYCNNGGCISGYYGNKCDTPCPTNCNGGCIQNNGDCEVCNDGYWGIKCQKQCPTNCRLSKCDKNNGYCSECKNYYRDGRCTVGCINGRYGNNCDGKCSTGCNNGTCNRNDGSCISGCISESGISPLVAGIIGALISMVVVLIVNLVYCCLKNKRHERDNSSDRTVRYTSSDNVETTRPSYENIQQDVTKPSYENIQQDVTRPSYENAQQDVTRSQVETAEECGSNCNGLCKSNGFCNNCTSGYYGDKCDKPCSTNCNDGCRQSDGYCINGCKPRYRGNTCNRRCQRNCYQCQQTGYSCIECNPGYWNYQCQNTCRNCNNRCQKSNGNCTGGCKKGFWGMKCNVNCNKCKQGCQQNNGYCNNGGCISGYYGDKCDKL
ncbi:hypothetical protein LOTGIDRAFT_176188, partial [Lottia gigantea]